MNLLLPFPITLAQDDTIMTYKIKLNKILHTSHNQSQKHAFNNKNGNKAKAAAKSNSLNAHPQSNRAADVVSFHGRAAGAPAGRGA